MSDPVVLSFHDALLRQSDMELLTGHHWLNDAVIAFWLEYIQRTLFPDQSRLLSISPEVTQLLKLGEEEEIGIFLDPLEARHKDFLLLPVNDNQSTVSAGGSHWSLLAYSKIDNKWYHYDSQRGSNHFDARFVVRRINKYLERDAMLVSANCTQQNNSYDCGIFVMINAQHVASEAARGLPLGNNMVPRDHATEMRQSLREIVTQLQSQRAPR